MNHDNNPTSTPAIYPTLWTRRRLLRWGVLGGLGAVISPANSAEARPRVRPDQIPHLSGIADVGSMVRGFGWNHRGLVVSAHADGVYSMVSPTPNASLTQKMLDSIMMRLSGESTAEKAWGSMFGPGDRVGVLFDELGNHRTRTRPAVIQAVLHGLKLAGVTPAQTVLWCMYSRSLPALGYTINVQGPGLKIIGADQIGYEKNIGLKFNQGLFGSTLGVSLIVSQLCTHVINIATLEDHPILGARLCLAQQAMSSLRSGQALERSWGGPHIGQIAAWNIMQQKFVLHFIDALAGGYDGGEHSWHPETILGGTDPVALDRIGFGMIESERQNAGKPLITGTARTPKYINDAAANGVGIADLLQIKHINLRIS